MSRRRMEGFQKPLANPDRVKAVGLAVISYIGDESAACSCGGWAASHTRSRVLEDAIDRHLLKKHQGRGIRL